MTRKVLQKDSNEALTTFSYSTSSVADMHTHRMGSVLEERRDPNFNSWTEIIPERVKHAAKG